MPHNLSNYPSTHSLDHSLTHSFDQQTNVCLFAAPAPYYAQNILATKCLDRGRHIHKQEWFVPFGPQGEVLCENVQELTDPRIEEEGITANQVRVQGSK